jgi:processing peptidase subunit alpha
MLKSSMMMQLESRLVQCEDIARQFATYGVRDTQAQMCAKIDAVTAEDVMRVAQRMLSHPPAVGVVGHDLTLLPPYEQIEKYCANYYAQSAKLNKVRFMN